MPQSRRDRAAEVPRYLICLLPALVFAQPVDAQQFDTASPRAATRARITDMGTLGTESIPFGISGDGKVVVGTSNFHVTHWTRSAGLSDFGKLPGFAQAQANSVSHDGRVIVGHSSSLDGSQQALIWTPDTGMYGLPPLPGYTKNVGLGVSADGAVYVGTTRKADGTDHAFRWGLGGYIDLTPNFNGGAAMGANYDGTVVVGQYSGNDSHFHAFRYTTTAGLLDIAPIPACTSQPCNSWANAVSADGSVVTGRVKVGMAFQKAFRWTETGGMKTLGNVPGCSFCGSVGLALSDDGTVIVGEADGEAFRWTQRDGMKKIKDLLQAAGVTNASHWQLIRATGVSADGTTIVGHGKRDDVAVPSQHRAWIATLPLPPKILRVTPAKLATVAGGQGGPFAPTMITYRIATTGGDVPYTIQITYDPPSPRWLRAPQGQIATPTGRTATFVVKTTAAAPGVYNATIAFKAANGRILTERKAKLTVLP